MSQKLDRETVVKVAGLARLKLSDAEIDAVRPSLEALASSWTEGLTQPQEIVERLSQHLRSDFRYELDHDHSLADDPVLHFFPKKRSVKGMRKLSRVSQAPKSKPQKGS